MGIAVVGHKRWHPQVFMHRVRVQMQAPDDFRLGFPRGGKLMHLLMHRHLPGTSRTRGRGLTSRELAELAILGSRLSWSKGCLLSVLVQFRADLTEYIDVLRQRFLDHFPPIFEHMPAIEDVLGVRRAFCGSLAVTGSSITGNHFDSSMPVQPVSQDLLGHIGASTSQTLRRHTSLAVAPGCRGWSCLEHRTR